MQTVLFHSTIFGPIHSRRLGTSLGVNLMPNDGKVCTFDCLYCEAGFNAQGPGKSGIPAREQVATDLEAKLSAMKEAGEPLDVITFSGNGEPTLHPDFNGVIDDTIRLRDKYFPGVKISVLSNATMLGKPEVNEALRRVDNNIQKLDSALDPTVRLIDRPTQPSYKVDDVVRRLAGFDGHVVVQTMMLRGEHDGKQIDNTTPEEVDALINAYKHIRPAEVMLYSIDRKTPAEHLRKVPREELDAIADRIRREAGIEVQVTG
ncbi:MAG: radical SAM protein [Candidatus Amulumruptor caecigallinarius]|nr:radical SAM protein [Candidatus Amulumruptor caecigallinarius]MCM1396425.1 radical SAM protein [Candidatus Amulumruptor caecigallinarius]MCM1453518.1 radical SAM protein [bacterium]